MSFYFKKSLIALSKVDVFKMYFYSLLWGFWTLFMLSVKRLWHKKIEMEERGNPPTCLTDSSIGHHLYIKLKGVKLHYVEAGEKNNPLILFLHGFPDCWITWRYQIPELAKYFRVVAVDLKGFGDSDKPEGRANYKVEILIEELQELIRSLGAKSCTIIGHDIGALLGWYLVHLQPQIVERFIALASPHPNLYWKSLPGTTLFNKRWVELCQLPYLPEYQALQEDLDIINKCYQHLSTNAVGKSYLEAYKYAFSRKDDWTGPINYFRNLPFWRLQCGKKLSSVPCLLVIGNKDTSVQMEDLIKSTEYLEKFNLKVVEGASHYLHQQRPNEINKLIIDFLIDISEEEEEGEKSRSGLVGRVFEAGNFAVKCGNSVLSAVHKKTNGLASRVLYLGQTTS